MPIYEFACPDCGQPFEKLVRSASAVSEVTCPNCGSAKVHKKVSMAAAPVRSGGGSSASASASTASCAPGGL